MEYRCHRLGLWSGATRFFLLPKAKPPCSHLQGGIGIKYLAMTYSHMANATLPLALSGFTSEFGKGSGGSHSLWSPDKLVGRLPGATGRSLNKADCVWGLYGLLRQALATGTFTTPSASADCLGVI